VSSGTSGSSFQIVLSPTMRASGAASWSWAMVSSVSVRISSASCQKSLLEDCTMISSGCSAAIAGEKPA